MLECLETTVVGGASNSSKLAHFLNLRVSDCIASAGMLSQTYLEAVRSETILVPTVNFAFNTGEVIETPDSLASLRSITT